MKLISACFIFILLVFSLSVKNVHAQTISNLKQVSGGEIDKALLNTVPVRFLPNSPLYFSITFKEGITRFFKPSFAKRAEFDFVLGGKRLKESYLLWEKGDFSQSDKNLIRYQKRLSKTNNQINKARAQNQDLEKIIGDVSEDLQYHEVLLLTLKGKFSERLSNLDGAIKSFLELVSLVDKLKPGVGDRFRNLDTNSNIHNESPKPTAIPSPTAIESSPSASPRRIIY